MDLEYTSKRFHRFLLFVCLLAFVVMCLSGCHKKYPYDTDSRWVSVDPEFVLEYWHEDGKNGHESYEYVVVDGEKTPVWIGYRPGGYFDVFVNPDPSSLYIHLENRAMIGKIGWDRDVMVITVESDTLFNNAYSEIRFVREELKELP